MPTMAMEKMHQRAGQQHKVYPVAGQVIPMLAQKVEADNGGKHPKGGLERTVHRLRALWSIGRFLVLARHLGLSHLR